VKLGGSAVLQIPYVKIIPYPFAVVLDQYFDYEHIAHVHPSTLGEYVLVENMGCRIIYDQLWPADRRGRRATSRVIQNYQPPGDIWFDFVAGKHKRTKVFSQLRPHPDGTGVRETYYVPWLPNWSLLRRLIAPVVYRQVDRIWDEDLRAGVCIGGWPGTPGLPTRVDAEEWRRPLEPGVYRIGPVDTFAPGSLTIVNTPGGQVLIAHTTQGFRAVHPTCPHTGGPLHLGQMENGCFVCPWHGARFGATDGQALAGPTRIPLPVYSVHIEGGEVVVEA
jgi:nitrite reductase/ring-hydroxylating ferredoxin subunit